MAYQYSQRASLVALLTAVNCWALLNTLPLLIPPDLYMPDQLLQIAHVVKGVGIKYLCGASTEHFTFVTNVYIQVGPTETIKIVTFNLLIQKIYKTQYKKLMELLALLLTKKLHKVSTFKLNYIVSLVSFTVKKNITTQTTTQNWLCNMLYLDYFKI